jgi:DNA-binding PadR family transcriptional regulator
MSRNESERSDPGTVAEAMSTALTQTVFHVLLALTEGPLHGYAIMKRVELESGVPMGPGTIYGSLSRLADAGWVREEEPDVGADARRGKAFGLTAAGRDALRAEAARITRLARLKMVRTLAPETGR